jgi:hypothetical protein
MQSVTILFIDFLPIYEENPENLKSAHKSGVQGTPSPAGVRGVPALSLSSKRAVGPPE